MPQYVKFKKTSCMMHPYARKPASQGVLGRMQLALDLTRPTPHGAWRLALGARNISFVGVKFDVVRTGLVGTRRSMVAIRPQPCLKLLTPPEKKQERRRAAQ